MKWLNWPNRFTIARILFVAPLVICLLNLGEWEHARHVALGLFCAVSLTDALDGYLARRRYETQLQVHASFAGDARGADILGQNFIVLDEFRVEFLQEGGI